MALVGPSNGQLLLRLLSGLSHFLSSCLFSSSHTSRGIAEFHVSDFRHNNYLAIKTTLTDFSLTQSRAFFLRSRRFCARRLSRKCSIYTTTIIGCSVIRSGHF